MSITEASPENSTSSRSHTALDQDRTRALTVVGLLAFTTGVFSLALLLVAIENVAPHLLGGRTAPILAWIRSVAGTALTDTFVRDRSLVTPGLTVAFHFCFLLGVWQMRAGHRPIRHRPTFPFPDGWMTACITAGILASKIGLAAMGNSLAMGPQQLEGGQEEGVTAVLAGFYTVLYATAAGVFFANVAAPLARILLETLAPARFHRATEPEKPEPGPLQLLVGALLEQSRRMSDLPERLERTLAGFVKASADLESTWARIAGVLDATAGRMCGAGEAITRACSSLEQATTPLATSLEALVKSLQVALTRACSLEKLLASTQDATGEVQATRELLAQVIEQLKAVAGVLAAVGTVQGAELSTTVAALVARVDAIDPRVGGSPAVRRRSRAT